MPFTPAHPAILLPLRKLPKQWYSVSGLVMGSMIPDVEYFIRIHPVKHYSHSLWGLVWLDLPLSFILLLFFHGLVKDALIEHLPPYLKGRFIGYKGSSTFFKLIKNWWVVAISILIGGITHFIWDSFTHDYGVLGLVLPQSIRALHLDNFYVPILKGIQIIHSITGFGFIVWYIKLKPIICFDRNKIDKYWLIVVSTIIITCILRFYLANIFLDFDFVYFYFAIGMSTGTLIGISIAGIIWKTIAFVNKKA